MHNILSLPDETRTAKKTKKIQESPISDSLLPIFNKKEIMKLLESFSG